MAQSYARVRMAALIAAVSMSAMTTLSAVLMKVVAAFDDFAFAVSQVLNPVWSFVGVVLAASQVLYGYAVKAPFRLLVYDS